ncbi:oligosaccharide flippase family protein, partial [Methanosarcina mazei]
MVLADIITKLFAIIVIIYLARYLGVEDFGKYNFI